MKNKAPAPTSLLPTISIITPSYNQGQFIEATIQSVMDQHYPSVELIVMDGGSTDQTVAILKKYQQLIKKAQHPGQPKLTFSWRSQRDKGQSDAINQGLKLATGEVLAYLNSDDTYELGTLKLVGNYFQQHPRTNFIYGKGQLIDFHGKIIGLYNDRQVDFTKLHQNCGISQPTAFWRRSVYKQIGQFDVSFQFTMDYDYWVRVSQKFDLVYLPQILANTRIHPAAKTSSQTQRLLADAIRVQKKYYPFVHPDWIFTYTDGLIHSAKNGNWFQRVYYWLALLTTSFWLQLWWNHHLPATAMRRQYRLWLVEMIHDLGKFHHPVNQ